MEVLTPNLPITKVPFTIQNKKPKKFLEKNQI
jgi:hypothetical protein